MPVKYRKLARKDLAAAHRLSLEVGWPHRLEDWDFVQRLGTGHVAIDDGVVVGTILTWKHDARNASLGMVIVDPRMQGRGIGKRLMRLGLQDLSGRSVLLYGTSAGLPLYEKLGFKGFDEVEQHQGIARQVPVVPLGRGERLRPVGTSDAAALAALATRASGFSRGRVVRRLLETGKGIALASGDDIIGFAILRRFGRGLAIGPVVAPDAACAKALVSHWVTMYPGKFLRIDATASGGLGPWLDGIGLVNVANVVTMAKGRQPKGDGDIRTFAIVSQSLG
jgi:GNAT superfamily N-acetyltransferase